MYEIAGELIYKAIPDPIFIEDAGVCGDVAGVRAID